MKKIFLFCLISSNIFAIDLGYKSKINSLENKKTINLGNYSKVSVSSNVGYNLNKNFGIDNNIQFGDFAYSLSYTTDNKFSNTISFQKSINDILSNEFHISNLSNENLKHQKIDSLKKEYENILNIYSEIILLNKKAQNLDSLINEMNTSLKIIDENLRLGRISTVDYDLIKLELLQKQNSLQLVNHKLSKLEKQLNSMGYEYTGQQFEINEIDEQTIINNIDRENKKIQNKFELDKLELQKAILSQKLPNISVGASHNFESKSWNVSLGFNKIFDLNKIKIEDNLKNKKANLIDIDLELKEFELMKNNYQLAKQRSTVYKNELEANEVKYKYGKISYKDLLEKKIKYNDILEQELKSKNDLAIYILLKEI